MNVLLIIAFFLFCYFYTKQMLAVFCVTLIVSVFIFVSQMFFKLLNFNDRFGSLE